MPTLSPILFVVQGVSSTRLVLLAVELVSSLLLSLRVLCIRMLVRKAFSGDVVSEEVSGEGSTRRREDQREFERVREGSG